MLIQISIWVVASLVSGLIGYALSLSSKRTRRQQFIDTIISALLGTVFVTVFQLQLELASLRDLKNEILHPNELKQVENAIEDYDSSTPMFNSTIIFRDILKEELRGLLEGRIKLRDEEEVITEWERLFGEAGTAIEATNYVSVDFWTEGSEFSLKQLKVQGEAIKRGVNIRRIYIYDAPEEIEQIRRLAMPQEQLGIKVRYIQKDKISSMPAYTKCVPVLGGTNDFVIFDLNAVLLTYVDHSRSISMGILSKERTKVDNARDLFERIWGMSGDGIE